MIPYWITGEVKILIQHEREAFVKVPNGNIYPLRPSTPGIKFEDLQLGMTVEIEVTDRLGKVYYARILR